MAGSTENNNYSSLVQSIEQATKNKSTLDDVTIQVAEEALLNTDIDAGQKEKLSWLLNEYKALIQQTHTEVAQTQIDVEKNPDQIITELVDVIKSKNIWKFTESFSKSVIKQLDFSEEKHPEKYTKMLLLLAEISNIYDKPESTQNTDLEWVLKSEWKKLQIIITEASLDLENNTLEKNLDSYHQAKTSTVQKMILDYIHETEIKNKGYTIRHDVDNSFLVVNRDNRQIRTNAITTIQDQVSSQEMKDYVAFQKTDEYELMNSVPVLWDSTVKDIIRQASGETQKEIKKFTETTWFKMLLPLAALAFIFWIVGGKMSFWKRLLVLLGWGAALFAGNISAQEMWHGSLFTLVKNGINEATDGLVKTDDWKQKTRPMNVFNEIEFLNDNAEYQLGNNILTWLFTNIYSNDHFKNTHISVIERFITNKWAVAKDVFGEPLPKKENWSDYTTGELQQFLRLTLWAKDSADTYGDHLLQRRGHIPGTSPQRSQEPHSLIPGTDLENTQEARSLIPGTDLENTQEARSLIPGTDLENTQEARSLIPGTDLENTQEARSLIPGTITAEELENNEIIRYQTIWYFENGTQYLFWEDGTDTALDYDSLSPNFKEAFDNYYGVSEQAENLLFILNTIGWKTEEIDTLNQSLNQVHIYKLDETIPQLQTTIQNIVWALPWSLGDVSDRVGILEYLREEGLYDAVSREIVEKNFDEIVNLSEEDLQNFIENGTTNNKIDQLKREDSDLYNKVVEKKNEIEEYIAEFRSEILSQPEYEWLDQNAILKSTKNIFLTWFTKHLLFTTQRESEMGVFDVNQQGSAELKLFWEMEWVWLLDISDKNIDFWWKEALIMVWTQAIAIGIWALTMWAWTIAVNALVHGTRWVRGLKQMSNIWKIANGTIKWSWIMPWTWVTAAKLARWVSTWALGWVSFNAWYTLVNSGFAWENLYSKEWFMDAAKFWIALKWFEAFKNIYRGVAWVSTKWNILKESSKFVVKHGVNIWVPVAIAMWLDWWKWALDISFDEWEWTSEEVLQAMTIVASYALIRKYGSKDIASAKKWWEQVWEFARANSGKVWEFVKNSWETILGTWKIIGWVIKVKMWKKGVEVQQGTKTMKETYKDLKPGQTAKMNNWIKVRKKTTTQVIKDKIPKGPTLNKPGIQ